MLATSRISGPGHWSSATRRTRQHTALYSRNYGPAMEPAYRIMEVGSCTRMRTCTLGGLSATVVVDETTDEREYTYGWFRENPLNPSGAPMTFFCTIPESGTHDSDEPDIRLHFREITRAVRRRPHRNDPHRYFELVLTAPRQVFDPFRGVWENRLQVIGHTRPIPVQPPLTFQTAVQQMEVINGRRCLIALLYHTQGTVRSMVRRRIENSANQQPPRIPRLSHVQPFEDRWQENFDSREVNSRSTLDDDMERVIAGIRDML